MTEPIRLFRGEWHFLSNFHPCVVVHDGTTYPSAENAYQAAKCAEDIHKPLFIHVNAAEAKKLGRKVPMRPDWEDVKLDVMRQVVRAKFLNDGLQAMLLATGDAELIEGNWWHDNFWGNCECDRCDNAPKGPTVGQNWLGRILMEVRDEIRDSRD